MRKLDVVIVFFRGGTLFIIGIHDSLSDSQANIRHEKLVCSSFSMYLGVEYTPINTIRPGGHTHSFED